MTSAKKPALLAEVPTKDINALIERSVAEVDLRVLRRTPDGRIGTIKPSMRIPTGDLLNGKIEEFLDGYAGGGEYQIQIRDINSYQALAPKYKVILPGNSRDPKAAAQPGVGGGMPFMMPAHGAPQMQPQMQQQHYGGLNVGGVVVPAGAPHSPGVAMPQLTAPGQVSPPPAAAMPPWARSLPYHEQWGVYYQQQQKEGKLREAGPATQLAVGYAQTFDARNQQKDNELATLRERQTQQEAMHRKELADMRDTLNQERLQREKEAAAAQLTAMQEANNAKYAALEARIAQPPPKPAVNWEAIVGIAATVGPALFKLIGDGRASTQLAQLEREKMSQTALLAATTKDKGPDWVKLLPLAMPIITEFLKNNGPIAQAEIQGMQDEQKMMLFKMLGDFQIEEARARGETPWYLPFIQSLTDALPEVAQQLAVMKSGGAPKALPGAAAAVAGAQGGQVIENDDAIWASLQQANPEAANVTQIIFDKLEPALGFHTHEWRIVLFNLHAKTEVEQMVELFVEHLLHCQKFMLLPEPLANVFEDPEAVLGQVLQMLPIWQWDAEYAQIIVVNSAGAIQQIMAGDDEEEEVDVGEHEAPAAAAPVIDLTPGTVEVPLAPTAPGDGIEDDSVDHDAPNNTTAPAIGF